MSDVIDVTLGKASVNGSVGQYGFLCAVRSNGTVWCAGDNTYGQLGDGSTTARLEPVQVPGVTEAVEVAASRTDHGWVGGNTCARRKDGSVWCWGTNNYGQLGDGSTDDRPTATKSLAVGATHLVSGGYHYCGRFSDGTLKCWGLDYHGQLARTPSPTSLWMSFPTPEPVNWRIQ
ncbi:MAG TPA: hypothetical protein VGF45_07580, partial [Polyangia bacterium]